AWRLGTCLLRPHRTPVFGLASLRCFEWTTADQRGDIRAISVPVPHREDDSIDPAHRANVPQRTRTQYSRKRNRNPLFLPEALRRSPRLPRSFAIARHNPVL